MRGVLRLGVSGDHRAHLAVAPDGGGQPAYPNLSLKIEVDITPNLRARLLARGDRPRLLLGPLAGAHGTATACCATIPNGFPGEPGP